MADLISAVKLIRDFFELSGSEAIREFKALTGEDKAQLASAIARAQKLTPGQCNFSFVEY